MISLCFSKGTHLLVLLTSWIKGLTFTFPENSVYLGTIIIPDSCTLLFGFCNQLRPLLAENGGFCGEGGNTL